MCMYVCSICTYVGTYVHMYFRNTGVYILDIEAHIHIYIYIRIYIYTQPGPHSSTYLARNQERQVGLALGTFPRKRLESKMSMPHPVFS